MKAVVKKRGNSASVRIPAAVLQAAKLRLDDSVDVREESGRIVIEPVPRKEYTLSELRKGITPENLHQFAPGSRFWQTPWAKRPGDAACLCARRRRHCLEE